MPAFRALQPEPTAQRGGSGAPHTSRVGAHRLHDQRGQLVFCLNAILFRDEPLVDTEGHVVRNNFRVDTAADQAHIQRGRADAGHLRPQSCQFRAVRVERLQDAHCGLQRIDASVRHGGVRLPAVHLDLEVQTAVVRDPHTVRESRGDDLIGAGRAPRAAPRSPLGVTNAVPAMVERAAAVPLRPRQPVLSVVGTGATSLGRLQRSERRTRTPRGRVSSTTIRSRPRIQKRSL